jgi:hypothetical protein
MKKLKLILNKQKRFCATTTLWKTFETLNRQKQHTKEQKTSQD